MFQSDDLAAAQNAVSLFDKLTYALIIFSLLMIAITVALSVDRRRTAVQLAVGTIVGVLIARLIIRKISEDVVASIASQNRGAVKAVLDDAFGSLRGFTRWLFAIALLVAIVAFLMGKREWLSAARAQAVRAYGAGKGVATSERPYAHWIREHADGLQVAGPIVAITLLFIVGVTWVPLDRDRRRARVVRVVDPLAVSRRGDGGAARALLDCCAERDMRQVVVRRVDGFALVAQWIEHRFPKPGVAGPIPAEGTSTQCATAGARWSGPGTIGHAHHDCPDTLGVGERTPCHETVGGLANRWPSTDQENTRHHLGVDVATKHVETGRQSRHVIGRAFPRIHQVAVEELVADRGVDVDGEVVVRRDAALMVWVVVHRHRERLVGRSTETVVAARSRPYPFLIHRGDLDGGPVGFASRRRDERGRRRGRCGGRCGDGG